MAFKRKRIGTYKSNSKRVYRKRRYVRKPMQKAMVRIAKRVMLKKCETKYTTQPGVNAQLYHNGGSPAVYIYSGNLLNTTQGITQNNRIGDSILPVGCTIKLWLSNKLDRPNVMYRVMVLAVPPDKLGLTAPSDLFQGVLVNKMMDYVNTDMYNIVYHRIINPKAGDYSLESGATNKERSTYVTFKVPMPKGVLQFQTNNSVIPKYQKHCLVLSVIAYDAEGTLTSDNIASFTHCTRFYFKDP